MREIEKKMLRAIESRKDWHQSNTEVVMLSTCTRVYLHGNLICEIDHESNKRMFNTCGWNTPTTKSRLNALGANVRIKNFEMVNANTLEPVGCWVI